MRSPWRLAAGLFSRKQPLDSNEPKADTAEAFDPQEVEPRSDRASGSNAALDDQGSAERRVGSNDTVPSEPSIPATAESRTSDSADLHQEVREGDTKVDASEYLERPGIDDDGASNADSILKSGRRTREESKGVGIEHENAEPRQPNEALALDAEIQDLRARLCEKLRAQNEVMTRLLERYQ
ncbi:hypothetical protein [Rhizobium sp. 2MFCol3.1]|uniref:hypothetical protein n=1 Tax=Rhizobium sp. 2MFCol3.1 TaxID=1246459 RepID=UPI0012DF6CE5|nr:hypothetical protein [Rhizobium sp. 2MFCol3.1]